MSDADITCLLFQLLRERHALQPGEWATFAELMQTPAAGQRIDFFAVNTWRSKGYRAIAYEVKASRGDFLRELKQPQKRMFAENVSHESYFVSLAKVIRADEVPDGWGLIAPQSGARNLRIVKPAVRRKQIAWSMEFIISMARRAADKLPTQRELWDQATERAQVHA